VALAEIFPVAARQKRVAQFVRTVFVSDHEAVLVAEGVRDNGWKPF